MAVCGAFAGLAGSMDILGWQFHVATNDIPVSQVGFLGIAVALLGPQHGERHCCRGAALRRAAERHLAAQPRPDDLRARAGLEPDPHHPGPRRADRQRRRDRADHAAPRARRSSAGGRRRLPGAGGRARREHRRRHRRPHAGRSSRATRAGPASRLGFVAWFITLPPALVRTPGAVDPHRPAGDDRGRLGDRRRREAQARLGRDRGRPRRRRRRGGVDAVGRRQPQGRRHVVGARRRDAALRHAAHLRRARRHRLRAQRRRERRPGGHDAHGRVLRDLRRRPARLVVPGTARRHGRRRPARAASTPFFSINLRADQIVSGIAINFLAARHDRATSSSTTTATRARPTTSRACPTCQLPGIKDIGVPRRRDRQGEPPDVGRADRRRGARRLPLPHPAADCACARWASTRGRPRRSGISVSPDALRCRDRLGRARRDGRRVPVDRLRGLVQPEHDRRARLHRAGSGHLRQLAPRRRPRARRCCSASRARWPSGCPPSRRPAPCSSRRCRTCSR